MYDVYIGTIVYTFGQIFQCFSLRGIPFPVRLRGNTVGARACPALASNTTMHRFLAGQARAPTGFDPVSPLKEGDPWDFVI